MRIFISGGAGVIGRELVARLLARGADLFVGDLKACPSEWVGLLRYWHGDLNYIDAALLKDFDPDIFFHLAATFERSDESFSFFEENAHHNVSLSHYLLSCLSTAPSLKRVVFASSYLIYDPSLYLFSEEPETVIPLKEDSAVAPRNICGAAKYFHERELLFFSNFPEVCTFSFAAARIFRVCGKGSQDIISRWVRAALAGESVALYRPEGRFDYIFAGDVAEGLMRLADSAFCGVVNLGSGRCRAVQDVVDILKSHFPTLQVTCAASLLPYEASQASLDTLDAALRWQPETSLEHAIAEIIAYERRRQSLRQLPASGESILATSIGKKVPLLKAIKFAMNKIGSRQRGFFLHGSDSDSGCLGAYFVDTFWRCPAASELSIEAVIEYCLQNKIGYIIPSRDAELPFFAAHRQRLAAHGIFVMVSPLEAVDSCLDKERFAAQLRLHGLPAIPASSDIAELPPSCGYVVKERWGAGSKSMALDVPYAAAVAHAKALHSPIFQPYVSGKEWSVDLFVSAMGRVLGAVARCRDIVVAGESQVTTTVHFPQLEALCSAVAVHLKIQGHAIFQVIEDAEGLFHLIECNPRFGGASTASIAVGLDSFYWFLLEAQGNDLTQIAFNRSTRDIRQVRVAEDLVIPWQ